MDELFFFSIITICALVIFGTVLPIVLRIVAFRAASRRLQAMLLEQQQILAAGPVQPPPSGTIPPVVLPPIPPSGSTGNIYMPGGPAVVGGHVIVPGVGHKWKQ